jgi:hypothetical protein
MTGGGGFFWYNRSMITQDILTKINQLEKDIFNIKQSLRMENTELPDNKQIKTAEIVQAVQTVRKNRWRNQYEKQTQDTAQFLNSLPDNQINEDQLQEIINTERQQLYEEKQRAGRS